VSRPVKPVQVCVSLKHDARVTFSIATAFGEMDIGHVEAVEMD